MALCVARMHEVVVVLGRSFTRRRDDNGFHPKSDSHVSNFNGAEIPGGKNVGLNFPLARPMVRRSL